MLANHSRRRRDRSGGKPPARRRGGALAMHVARVALLAAILFSIRQQHAWVRAQQKGHKGSAVSLSHVRSFFPAAARLGPWDSQRGGQTVLDAEGRSLGYFVQTSPECDRIVGFSGPTNTLIAFDRDDRVLGIKVLSSQDTREHIEDVRQDQRFMKSFTGLTWDEAARHADVDAVSGATLTSLAIVEGICQRLGNAQPSLRFPRPLQVAELRPWLPRAGKLEVRPQQPFVTDVQDETGRVIGTAFRTSPASDSTIGYQGPTDTLVVLGGDGRIRGLSIRDSYDNEPYVRYVREDQYFWTLFEGMTLEELAGFDADEAGVEGVSGATMTSVAIARGLAPAARAALRLRPASRRPVVSARDAGTIAIVIVALVMCFSRLRGLRRVRIGFQLVLIAYLGFVNGDMVSQAMLVGWGQNGIPWRLAPGLVALTCAALAVPIFSKRQFYCHHVCPFGAAQQLVRRRVPWQLHLSRTVRGLLRWIPPLLLVLVVAAALLHWPISLTQIEPFHAFVVLWAGGATFVIAVVGLAVSAIVPMAYCRYGCPTGALLDYLRFHRHRGRVTRSDLLAVTLLVFALLVLFSH